MPEQYPKMILYACDKHKPKKCKSPAPCAYLTTGRTPRGPEGCPLGKNYRFKEVPTTELTV